MKKVIMFAAVSAATAFGVLNAQNQTETKTEQLDEVVVTALRATRNTPVAQTTITSEQVKKNNIGVDVPQMLELTPSVVTSSESGIGTGNTSFSIRGTDAKRINITIDGIPVNEGESHGVYWANMPDLTSSVNSIQIQRGVGTSSNGAGAFGATINLQTTRATTVPYTELSSQVGSYGVWRNSIKAGTGLLKKGFSFDLRYSNIQSDGYIDRSWTKHQSLFGAGSWQGKNTLIKASILHGEQHTGLSWSGVPGYAIDSEKYAYYEAGVPGYNPGEDRRYNPAGEFRDENGNIRYYDNQSDNYKQTHYRLHATHRFNNRLVVNASLHLTRGLGYYEEYKLNRKLKEYGLPEVVIDSVLYKKSDLVRQKHMDNYFYGAVFSANYTYNNLQLTLGGGGNRYDGDHFGKVLWVKYNNGKSPDSEWYRNTGKKDDYNIYAKANLQLTKAVNVYGDVQYRHIGYKINGPDDDLIILDQSHYFNFVNPKAGVFFKLSDAHQAYASFAVANREPTRTDFKEAVKFESRKTIESERLYDTEIGYQYSSNWLSAGMNLYYMSYKDQLVLTGKLNDVGSAIMENVDDSYRAGIELMAGVKFLSRLRFDANITLSRNKIKDFEAYTHQFDNSNDWNEVEQRVENLGTTDISFSPSVTGGGQLTYQALDKLSFLLQGKYVGKQYYDNTSSNDRKLDAYFVSNFRADYSFEVGGVNIGLQFLVNNIFNKKYITSAWVYRAVFADGSADYIENGFFPQAGTNVLGKLVISF